MSACCSPRRLPGSRACDPCFRVARARCRAELRQRRNHPVHRAARRRGPRHDRSRHDRSRCRHRGGRPMDQGIACGSAGADPGDAPGDGLVRARRSGTRGAGPAAGLSLAKPPRHSLRLSTYRRRRHQGRKHHHGDETVAAEDYDRSVSQADEKLIRAAIAEHLRPRTGVCSGPRPASTP